ncbi:MAG: lysylphosphatidylglycerol synthase transmembrane domain-containing protein [Actinomycetota bacterium]
MTAPPTLSRAIPFIRVAVSALLVSVLVTQLPRDAFGDLAERWTTASWFWMAAAIVATTAATAFGAARWHSVASAIGVRSSFRQLVPHHFAGQLVSAVLPSSVGGDAVRAHRLGRESGDRTRSLSSVIIDRLSGWVVLPTITLLAFALNPGLLRLGGSTIWAVVISVGAMVAFAAMVVSISPPRHHEGAGRLRRLAGTLRSSIHEVRRRPSSAVEPLVLSVCSTMLLVAAGYLAGRALGIDLSPTAAMAILPVVLMVQIVPLGVGGLGLREGALVVFLAPLGIAAAQAVILGIAIHLLGATVGLLGAPSLASSPASATERVTDGTSRP